MTESLGQSGASPETTLMRFGAIVIDAPWHYDERVHEQLLAVHERRWTEMHTYRQKFGDDAHYRELRQRMIAASREVSRYLDNTERRR